MSCGTQVLAAQQSGGGGTAPGTLSSHGPEPEFVALQPPLPNMPGMPGQYRFLYREQPVSIEFLHPQLHARRPDRQEALEREATILARCNHNNIVKVGGGGGVCVCVKK